jgi:hypothetical protein
MRKSILTLASWLSVLAVGAFLTGGSFVLPVIGEHHEHVCDTLDVVEEADPCHQAIHHHASTLSCDHKAHISQVEDVCPLCSLLAISCFQPGAVDDVLTSSLACVAVADDDDHQDHYAVLRWLQLDARGPPEVS